MSSRLPKEVYLTLLEKYKKDLENAKNEKEREKITLKMGFVKRKLEEYR